jgi:transposase
MKIWVSEWVNEGVVIDLKKLLPEKSSGAFLPRRWVVERTFSWLGQTELLRSSPANA